MKKELQDALRKQPAKTKPRSRIARKGERSVAKQRPEGKKPASKGKES